MTGRPRRRDGALVSANQRCEEAQPGDCRDVSEHDMAIERGRAVTAIGMLFVDQHAVAIACEG